MLQRDPAFSLTLSSSRLNPLPARTLVWYRTVGHLTIGRIGPDTGRGAIRRAFAWRAFLLGEESNKEGADMKSVLSFQTKTQFYDTRGESCKGKGLHCASFSLTLPVKCYSNQPLWVQKESSIAYSDSGEFIIIWLKR